MLVKQFFTLSLMAIVAGGLGYFSQPQNSSETQALPSQEEAEVEVEEEQDEEDFFLQEDEEDQEDQDDLDEVKEELRRLIRRIQELEVEFREAEENEEEALMNEIEEKVEEIYQRIEDLASEHGLAEDFFRGLDEDGEVIEWDEEEGDQEFTWQIEEIELERAELENIYGRLEFVQRLAEISESQQASAAYAILWIDEMMDAEESIEFLESIMEEATSESSRRLLQIKLAELNGYAGRQDEAKALLRDVILGN